MLSDSTSRADRIKKNEEYRDTRSIQRYIMLEQDAANGMMFVRDGGRWVGSLLSADALIAMPEIGVELPLAEAYEGVELAPEPGAGAI